MSSTEYRGRLAPSPTGDLHLGHARTFWIAAHRARRSRGVLVLRNDDLDPLRSKRAWLEAAIDDLHWLGLSWQEGPDVGGPFEPYHQSQRLGFYRAAFSTLRERGLLYPCWCSRKDIRESLAAPHRGEDEPLYPGTCRPARPLPFSEPMLVPPQAPSTPPPTPNWRLAVPPGQTVSFGDLHYGPQSFVAGRDFGDFVVWRHDDLPSYQLATVVDDAAMRITEVVRGADLLLSTARQILLYQALGLGPPAFFHCSLVTDAAGIRLAKRHASLSLKTLRQQGASPESLCAGWETEVQEQPGFSNPPQAGGMPRR